MNYALFAVYHHPRDTWAAQKGFLHERIIPMVKSQPGFRDGTWTYDGKESQSHGCVTFATEAEARALETFMRTEAARPNPFSVALVSLVVTEIIGEARGSSAS